MQLLKQNQTAEPILFLLVLSSDHVSPATGKTPTVTLSKNGAAFAAPAGAVSEVGNGVYALAGNATDANTLGPLWLHATEASSDPADEKAQVVAYDPRDVNLGLARLDAAVSSRSTLAAGAAMTLTSGERDAVAAALLDLANGVETGLTPRNALRLLAAALAGPVSGADVNLPVFKSAVSGSKNRISATTDANGNRSSVTTDLT